MHSKFFIILLVILINIPFYSFAETGINEQNSISNSPGEIEGNIAPNNTLSTETGIGDNTSNDTIVPQVKPSSPQKIETVGTPLSTDKEGLLSDSLEDLQFLVNKELDVTQNITNINTAHEITQHIKSQVLEQNNRIKNNVVFSSTNIYYQSSKEDITNLQDILKRIGLYKGEINGRYDSVVTIVQKYQIENNIVQSPQEAGYGRIGPKTKAQLEKDYRQAIEDKIYQEILAIVKDEIQKRIDSQTSLQNTSVKQKMLPVTPIITGKQITTTEIQNILTHENKKGTDQKMSTNMLTLFVGQIYGGIGFFSLLIYSFVRRQRRKKVSFFNKND